VAGGLSTIGAILAVIGTGAVVAAFLAAFFWLTDKLESAALNKAIDERLHEIAHGDIPVVPVHFHEGEIRS
jgi:uncharacterized membrane protein YciS (DUF1049 family)